MLDDLRILRIARGWQLLAVLAVTMTMIAGQVTSDAERRSKRLENELRATRGRLAERREVINRQRQEMATVAAAVDRLARTTSTLRERAVQARRLAHMEETRDHAGEVLAVSATFDGGMSIVSEDAAHALESLAWLDRQADSATDSIAVLTALVKERPEQVSRGVPSIWPVRGLVTSPFGKRLSPYGGEEREMHPGIDISASFGVPVTAAAPGEVLFAGRDGGYGSLVVVGHGGQLTTLYAHLSALYVREGQKVRRGQAVGAVGATGRATGAHLHYEVRVNGAPVDPRRYLAKK